MHNKKLQVNYKSFNELSLGARNFFDYIIKFNVDKHKNMNNNDLIDEVLAFIIQIEEQFGLHNEYFFAEKLLITHDLIKERIKHYKKFGFKIVN